MALRRRQMELLKEQRAAAIQQAVTRGLNPNAPMKDSGISWLGEIPAHWKVKRLRYLVEKGLVNGLFKKSEQFGSGAKLVNVFDIYRDDGINLHLAYFRPAAQGNPKHQACYEGNRFSVMRQLHFSTRTPDQSVDIAIFLNGLPIVSLELKNHFTGQNVRHAMAQYRRRDRNEQFWKRCLVHFALDDDAVYMTTKIDGKETAFLPFNRDTHNPIIYERFASSYLWDDFRDEDGENRSGILRADSLLLLIQNYLHLERHEKSGKEKMIFPRFHQLMAVRKLLAHAKANGSGHDYLIQHSAGSGKSNSIAWLAHQLANLCGADNQLVFDSIIVITDRRLLDR